MKLDPKIKKGKRPLTCLDVDQAREFVGKKCLFSDSYNNFVDIGKYSKNKQYIATLSIEENPTHDEYVFINNYDGYRYRLALPLEWIKEPKAPEFVPYTLDTLEQEFYPGDVIFFRGKEGTPKENNYYKCMYLGYLENNRILVILGAWLYAFDDLFKLYEIYRNGNWEPFGRKVETIDLNVI